MNAHLYRIILPVNDINRADAFYSKILRSIGKRVSSGRHYFDLGGTVLACYDPKADGDELGNWKYHENQYIYIAVSNLEEVLNLVKTISCNIITEIEVMPWGERLFYINDPFGNPICFVDEKTIFKG